MLAYAEWRRLNARGELNEQQAAFFQPKPVEALYDVEQDPHEVHNLAGDPDYETTLRKLRTRLQAWVKGLPDLSFYPESFVVESILPDGAAYGKAHRDEIAQLVDTADLALRPFDEAREPLQQALKSTNRWERYWGLIACACFGEEAGALAPEARQLLDDSQPLVRVRAAEFLAVAKAEDPRPTLKDVLATSDSSIEALLALNALVFVRDHLGWEIDAQDLPVKSKSALVQRRMEYLRGDSP